MAIKINVSQEDVARTRAITQGPGWYPLTVKNITVEENKKGDANNFVTDFEVNEGPDKGCRSRVWFSEKAMGMMVPFLKALGIDVPNTGLADFDLEPAIGRQLKGYLQIEQYEGKDQNALKDYRPKDWNPGKA